MNSNRLVSSLTVEELELIIQQLFHNTLVKFIPRELVYNAINKDSIPKGYISEKELCSTLDIYRQKMYYWRSHKEIGEMIKPFTLKVKRKNFYSLVG